MDIRDASIAGVDLPPAGIQSYPRVDDASVIPSKDKDEYDPCKSVLFTEMRGINSHLLAYVIIGIIVFTLCFYVIYTAGNPDKPLDGYYNYTSQSIFLDPVTLFVGGIISTIFLCLGCYLITKSRIGCATLTFTMFLLINVFLFFWYLNLMYRIDVVANGEDHDGNGSGYLIATIGLMLAIMYIGFKCKSPIAGTCMLVPIGWYMIVLYSWIFDGYTV